MASGTETPSPAEPYVPWYVHRPSAKRCEHILKALREFQSLIRHRDRMATDIDLAQPLETLLPNVTTEKGWWVTQQQIEAELQRRMLPVQQYLNLTGVGTRWTL